MYTMYHWNVVASINRTAAILCSVYVFTSRISAFIGEVLCHMFMKNQKFRRCNIICNNIYIFILIIFIRHIYTIYFN